MESQGGKQVTRYDGRLREVDAHKYCNPKVRELSPAEIERQRHRVVMTAWSHAPSAPGSRAAA